MFDRNCNSFSSHIKSLILLGVLFAATTLPFRSRFPVNWDAAQFVLGIEYFSVRMHQPHPPGYPLFIGIGQVVHWLLPAHTSLLVVTWLFAAATIGALYWFIWQLWRKQWLSFVTATALLINPLFWYYRETALTYSVDSFATVIVGALSYRSLNQKGSASYPAAVILGLVSGVRPSVVVLLLPVLVFPSVVNGRIRQTCQAVLLVAASVLVWFVPLVISSGGFAEYRASTESQALFALRTKSIMGYQTGMLSQLNLLSGAMIGGLNLLLLPAFVGVLLTLVSARKRSRNRAVKVGFFLSWLLPSFLFFGLVHLGQLGYLLLLIPPVWLFVARTWLAASELREPRRRLVTLVGLGMILIGHGISFPLLSWDLAARLGGRQGPTGRTARMLLAGLPTLFTLNASAIRDNDQRMLALTRIVKRCPAETCLVLCGPPLDPGAISPAQTQPDPFRTLAVSCPEHFIVDLSPTDSYPTAKGFRTGRLPAAATLSGVVSVLLLFEDIPERFRPKGLRVEKRTFDQQTYYEGTIQPAHENGVDTDRSLLFEFLGARFKIRPLL